MHLFRTLLCSKPWQLDPFWNCHFQLKRSDSRTTSFQLTSRTSQFSAAIRPHHYLSWNLLATPFVLHLEQKPHSLVLVPKAQSDPSPASSHTLLPLLIPFQRHWVFFEHSTFSFHLKAFTLAFPSVFNAFPPASHWFLLVILLSA